ncbi:hypothetical protein OpiT1DRAFT_05194 [Opitutaceae bacterium TAV1]|nr:hypothetical protein OpiT1DRAFT_05194 [Opitutaceae bacterium TAV1]
MQIRAHSLLPAFLTLLVSVAIFTMLSTHRLYANAGVFGGSGYDIELIRNHDIRMVSEDITITPARGPSAFDGTLPGMTRVAYTCVFKLLNLRDVTVSVQVGFPLDAGHLEHYTTRSKRPPPSFARLMADHGFIAHDNTQTYSVRYFFEDKPKDFRHLFVWDMNFAPSEEKELHITYTMPMSMGLHTTRKDQHKLPYNEDTPPVPAWQAGLAYCLLEYFGYVTRTGSSWADGTIGRATFTLRLGAFESYLDGRPFFEGAKYRDDPKYRSSFPVRQPARFRLLKPADGWTQGKDGTLIRTLSNYQPADDITVHYYSSFFPRTAEDTESLVAWLRDPKHRYNFAATPDATTADFDALRDIFLEFNGQRTTNSAIQAFVRQQAWYDVPPLRSIPDTVFETLDRLRTAP